MDLGFCTNSFPAETLEDLCDTQIPCFKGIFDKVSSPLNIPWSLDLQLGRNILMELKSPDRAHLLTQALSRHKLTVGSLNLFPLAPFQNKKVKKKVYSPNWYEEERTALTLIGAQWIVETYKLQAPFIISTLAGRFHKQGIVPDDEYSKLAQALEEICGKLANIREQTGSHILLALEPEPFTTLQRTEDVVQFWKYLKTPALKEHLAINLDCCHFSVMGEHPLEAYKIFRDLDIPVPKIHASTSLELRPPFDHQKVQTLREMDEPHFLHQTSLQNGKKILTFEDIPDSLAHIDASTSRIMCHFHMPLFLEKPQGQLATSHQHTQDLLEFLNNEEARPQIFVETYTWSILKKTFALTPETGISKELSYLAKTFSSFSH